MMLLKSLRTRIINNNNWSTIRNLSNETTTKAHINHPKQVFSGIQPTSVPHLGNYFGAIKPWVDMQKNANDDKNSKPMLISIVDLHAITLPRDVKQLNEYIYQCTASLIACGLDPAKTIIFQQSQVPYHGQLAWILGCRVTMPQLGRMHQFKFKSDGLAHVPLGVYTYPVLQAADILLYKATHVPVGEDQVQHLEFCREIASKFNKQFGQEFFPIPKTIEADLTKLRSLRDPSKKMSKSDTDPMSRIELTDDPKSIEKKLRKAVTDSESVVSYEPERRPGVSTLVDIEAACSGLDPEECVENALMRAEDTGEYKKHVARLLNAHLLPVRTRYERLIRDRAYLRRVLDEGSAKAVQIAEANYLEIRRIIGMS